MVQLGHQKHHRRQGGRLARSFLTNMARQQKMPHDGRTIRHAIFYQLQLDR
jgi:hypothetical protein